LIIGTLSPSHGWLDRWYQLARVGLQIGVPVRAEASTEAATFTF